MAGESSPVDINSYHVLERVGEGSFGKVFKGRKKLTGQVVALKFIPKVGRSDKELVSLKREINIMTGLKHPHIVQMFDSFETEKEVVFVTEYAEGDLFQILEDDGNLPESQVRDIACQLVSALYYLHSHRILHRDMKPQNILLGKGGVIKLCDFGFARAMSVSTLVLTSIKGTPLYMSPELVEEKPYDHTADLWSLGCILYELHTGAPPFYTNSIFQLVQLIVRDPVKWPDSMSSLCTSFLKGLLTKDPQKRLSWPDLLYHPFIADGVLVLSDSVSAFSPLTVTPSPDVQALKLQQVAEKTAPHSGESKLLRKARQQGDNDKKNKEKWKGGRETPLPARKSPAASVTLSHFDQDVGQEAGDLKLNAYTEARGKSKRRGQISRDYEREFPSVEVGPQLVQMCQKGSRATSHIQDNDSDGEWEKLAQETDPQQHNKALNLQSIIPRLKKKFLACKTQVSDGAVEGAGQFVHPLRVLQNLILALDPKNLHRARCEMGLPHLLFTLASDLVESPVFVQQSWCATVLGEIIVTLLAFWEKNCDWVLEETRMEVFSQTFVKILGWPDPNLLAPLASSVLSMFTHHGVSVDVGMDQLKTCLMQLPFESNKPQLPLPPGWGLCDGLLALVLHTLTEHEGGPPSSSLDVSVLLHLILNIGASLEETSSATDFCSANGMYALLTIMLFVFTKDPQSCVPLFSKSESKCIFTLGHLLDTEGNRRLYEGTAGRLWGDVSLDSLCGLSCQLLCFPFALDLPAGTMAQLLQLYHSCGIVTRLIQVIRVLPASLLELPLALLGRLLLCDPKRSVPCLRAATETSGFLSPPRAGGEPSPEYRTASSLLSDLLQSDVLSESAVEFLTLLSQAARYSSRPGLRELYLEPTVLRQALTHSDDRIRAATCNLLGNLDPFMDATVDHIQPCLQPAIFKDLKDCLDHPCIRVRRTACRAVGNWLGLIGQPGFQTKRSDAKGRSTPGWGKAKGKGKDVPSQVRVKGHADSRRRWVDEAKSTKALLVSLIADPDAVTRRHCCVSLGNLARVYGEDFPLSEDGETFRRLLTAACDDSHYAVRQAALATLTTLNQQVAV